ncbi:aminodeoxychorismate synthase component I [Planococcus sp. NCCP-2050]|uniref:aminodeoxychorismate synthase component I n=1 Tax=Planococcus sp. NCCP-2050 TaxID=2944679 RepID=UPI00203F0A07|nr:aminodeoxychorismate synthase component I [Planococcus sp. NCCP-2050]GKW46006.1 aminodeoxychorismate synthase, component I [Planococcus sp. NCCP-2050]
MNPYLLYEFRNSEGKIEPKAFKDPVEVLQTERLEDIPAIMEAIEAAIDKGFYVAGYLSYEAAPAFNPAMKVKGSTEMPLVWFGIFDQVHIQSEEFPEKPYQVSEWIMASSKSLYKEGISRIKTAIEEGHTYQVNYTERLHADFTGSHRSFYRQLARNQQADYGAYLDLGKHRILSASPELFFRIKDGTIEAKPMKGTARRGRTLAEDKVKSEELLASEKEQAENLMIVDLLRNDMSRLAKKGTVHVSDLYKVETYPTVHQLTSTVKAELQDALTVFDWFKALFPCGSITGAPKVSTMEYIAALEQTSRDVYCGAIGFITPEKEAIFNVPIRTVVIDTEKQTARYGVGGGITWDSTSEGEYQELVAKAEVLTERRPEFQLLESLKLEDGQYPLIDYHMERMKNSAAYFYFPGNERKIRKQLKECAKKHSQGVYKVRLLLSKTGEITVEAQKITPIKEPVLCKLAVEPVNSQNPFLFHKTTHRQVYKQHESEVEGVFSVLLWNEHEQLTEFAIGNLVVEMKGRLYTPPVENGLLAGTYRQFLLDTGKLEEKEIYKNDLEDCEAVWFINGVRGWLKVKIIQ